MEGIRRTVTPSVTSKSVPTPTRAPAAAPGPGRPDDGVVPGDDRGEPVGVEVLHVGDDGTCTGRAHVVGVVGVADQPDGLVPTVAEAAGEKQGDLAVTAGDDDAHEVRNLPDRG